MGSDNMIQIIVLWVVVIALMGFSAVQFSAATQWKQAAHNWQVAAETFCDATVLYEAAHGLEAEPGKCDFDVVHHQPLFLE